MHTHIHTPTHPHTHSMVIGRVEVRGGYNTGTGWKSCLICNGNIPRSSQEWTINVLLFPTQHAEKAWYKTSAVKLPVWCLYPIEKASQDISIVTSCLVLMRHFNRMYKFPIRQIVRFRNQRVLQSMEKQWNIVLIRMLCIPDRDVKGWWPDRSHLVKGQGWAVTLEGSGDPMEHMGGYRWQDVLAGARKICLISIYFLYCQNYWPEL